MSLIERPRSGARSVSCGVESVTHRPLHDDHRTIEDLRTHPDQYVTVSQLAYYWRVSRKQIYKQIDAGLLSAIRLGPRAIRIHTDEAIHFEHTAKTSAS
jgi:excisionase family DNA binding protein